MTYKKINLEGFIYSDDEIKKRNLLTRVIYLPMEYLVDNFFLPGFRPPGKFKSKDELAFDKLKLVDFFKSPIRSIKLMITASKSNDHLERIGNALGFEESSFVTALALHQKRIISRDKFRFFFYFLFAIIGSIPIFLYSGNLLNSFDNAIEQYLLNIGLLSNTAKILSIIFGVLYAIPFTIIMFVIYGTAFRFASILTGRFYAETQCIEMIFYSIIELNRDNILIYSNRRKSLIRRLNVLSQNILLLSSRFASKDENNQQKIEEHFKRLEKYVRKQEIRIVAPKDKSLDLLREEIYNLAPIFITGTYGKIELPEVDSSSEEIHQKKLLSRLTFLPRILLGIVLPLAGIVAIIWQPQIVTPIGLERDVVFLILVAWLVLAIDATLKLGIVASITDLAKGFRDLK